VIKKFNAVKNKLTYINSMKQEFHYSIKLWLFDDPIIFN